MYDRRVAIERSRVDAQRLGAVNIVEVTPSRRDFGLYVATQKQSLAVIAALGFGEPLPELVNRAVALDDAEVAAIALSMGEGTLEPAAVRELSKQLSAPLLRRDYVVATNQIYHSRLQGFDAILIPGFAVSADELTELAAIAASVHMSAVIEVENEQQASNALRLPHASIAIEIDPAAIRLVQELDRSRVAIGLGDRLASAAEAKQLEGVFDAVLVDEMLAGELIASASA